MRLLAGHPVTIECLLKIEKIYKPEQGESVLNLLQKLNAIAEIITKSLEYGKERVSSSEYAEEVFFFQRLCLFKWRR